jgi:hypothetical protein
MKGRRYEEQSIEHNPTAIRINMSLVWMSRGDDSLGRRDRLRSGL